MPEGKIKILYVDDEIHNLTTFKATFRTDYEIHICESADLAMKVLEERDIDLIITDQRMPKITGIEFLESIIDKYPDPARIILTGYSDLGLVINAINRGRIHYYMTKPWVMGELKNCIEIVYESYSLKQENKKMIEKLKLINTQIEFLLSNYKETEF